MYTLPFSILQNAEEFWLLEAKCYSWSPPRVWSAVHTILTVLVPSQSLVIRNVLPTQRAKNRECVVITSWGSQQQIFLLENRQFLRFWDGVERWKRKYCEQGRREKCRIGQSYAWGEKDKAIKENDIKI